MFSSAQLPFPGDVCGNKYKNRCPVVGYNEATANTESKKVSYNPVSMQMSRTNETTEPTVMRSSN